MSTSILSKSTQEGNNSSPLESHDEELKLNVRARAWCITSFQETVPDYNPKEMKYYIVGLEKCPTTGRIHWQCYVYWKHMKSWKKMQEIFPKCWFRKCKGSAEQNRDYCSKEGNWDEWGEIPMQGKRNDLIALKKEILENNLTVDEICEADPFVHHLYGRTLDRLESIKLNKKWRTEMTKGYWIYGETGKGKSHKVFENYHPDTHYVLNLRDNGWWEKYKGQENVIINDFRGEIIYNDLLQLIDKWPYDVKKRNVGSIPFISKNVYITSSLRPEEVYHNRNEKDSIKQLLRRIEIIKLD